MRPFTWLRERGPSPHEWLLLAALLWFTHAYFWLMDDAFIYFRYVDNLLFLGRGLVWNAREYVEGFSSPLWLLLLAAARSLGFDWYAIVYGLSLGCAGAYGAMTIWLSRELSTKGPRVNFALAASAAHYGLTTHFSSGLETPLVQLFATFYAAALVRPSSRALLALLALGPLVRPELALVTAGYGLSMLVATRRVPLFLVAATLACNGAWLAFRVYYYADLLPNTFYVKHGASVRQGVAYLTNVLRAHHWPTAITVLGLLALMDRRTLRAAQGVRFARALMLGLAALYTAYVVRIGGDMLYHRYLSFPVCLSLCASSGIVEATLGSDACARVRGWLAPGVALSVAVVFGLLYPAQLTAHPLDPAAKSRHVAGIADAIWHRRHAKLAWTPERRAQDLARRAAYAVATGVQRDPRRVFVTGFCASAYARWDHYVVQDYGLTDPMLARVPAVFGRPGHKLVQIHAAQLATFRRLDRLQFGPERIAGWLAQKKVPRWIRRNAAALPLLERKMHNDHDFLENLRLATTRIELR